MEEEDGRGKNEIRRAEEPVWTARQEVNNNNNSSSNSSTHTHTHTESGVM